MSGRLLLVITSLDHGGAETQVAAIARGLQQRGWHVEVASLLPPGAIASQIAADAIPVHSLGMARGRADPGGILRLVRLVRRMRPTVVHSHMVHANLLCRVARPLSPMPVLVSTVHSVDEEGWWREVGYRITNRLADATTTVSQAAWDRYRRLGLSSPERLVCVPNGIEVERFLPDTTRRRRTRDALAMEDGEQLWVAVGRLAPPKDPLSLVHAFALHARAEPRARLILVGDGPLAQPARHLVTELGLDHRVRMLGSRSDVPDLLAAADAFVLSSHWEGLPVSVLEAGVARLPVVATAVAGTVELVEDGITGFLAEPGNPASLAAAMGRVAVLSPAERVRLTQAAAAQAREGYGMAQVLDRWEALYAGIARQRGSTGTNRGET